MNPANTRRLLKDLARTGVYRLPRPGMDELLAGAEACGFAVRRVALAGLNGKQAFLKSMAAALDFPEWFGNNWDALADCLGDLSWLPAEGYLLVLEGAEGFRSRQAAEFATALQVLADAAEAWREADIPFWVLVDARGADLPTLPDIG